MRKAWWNLWMGRDVETPEGAYRGPLPPDAQGLTDLARGMQHVALATTDILGQHSINVLNHYFDPETREPVETRLRLRNGQVIDVPLIALVPPSTLALRQLKIKLAVAVQAAQVRRHRYDKGMPEVDRSRFTVSLASSDSDNVKRKRGGERVMDLEMVFEAHDPPEAMHRIVEQFAQYVVPLDEDEANQYGTPKNGDHVVDATSPESPPTDAAFDDDVPPDDTRSTDDPSSDD